jgi:hypothetical protein
MCSWNWFSSILMHCSLSVVLGWIPVANAATVGTPFLRFGESARNNVIEIKDRSRGSLPIAPSYLAYDWPYYFGRGHYSTHIGPGYVYYGYPYTYRSSHRYGGRCSYWSAKSLHRAWIGARRCVDR